MRDDWRAINGEGVVAGRDPMMDNIRTIYELDTEIVRGTLAVRGDHLCSPAWSSAFRGLRVGDLDVIGGDDEGRAPFQVMFDEDQLDAALAELDERWIAGEGAEHEYMVRRLGDFRAAQSWHDWLRSRRSWRRTSCSSITGRSGCPRPIAPATWR